VYDPNPIPSRVIDDASDLIWFTVWSRRHQRKKVGTTLEQVIQRYDMIDLLVALIESHSALISSIPPFFAPPSVCFLSMSSPSVCLPLSVCLSGCQSVCPSALCCLFSLCLSLCLSVCLSLSPVSLSVCLHVILSLSVSHFVASFCLIPLISAHSASFLLIPLHFRSYSALILL